MNRKSRRATQAGGRSGPQPAADPGFIAAFLENGRALDAAGRDEEAMETAKRLILLQETKETREFFVECVKKWKYFPGAEEFRDILARALREAWTKSSALLGIVLGILEHSAIFGPAVRRATTVWPRRLPLDELLGAGGLAALADDALLLALLESGKVFGVEAEIFFTSLRAGLLDIAMRDRDFANEAVVRFTCALARQCDISEYVYDLTPDESNHACSLRDRIGKALARKEIVSPMELAVLAAYFRLDCLPSDALLKRSWPKGFAALLEQQIHGPRAEARHRASIPRITPIADATSVKVQNQYEENPYPRWVKLPAVARSMPVDEWFRIFLPMANYRKMGKVKDLDILIAGCGTGQHSIMFAQSYPGAKVLAVDLSIASLSYAKEKTRAMGMDNIEFAQADILELGNLGRTFDIISSGGVLHHLADMEKGWRTLLSLLRQDGCMHVGLYSELARRDIVVAQQWLSQRGFTAKNIRQARQELIAAAATDRSLKAVLEFPDFYSTSNCRDLLFHMQERRCTIPQIAKFLDENNLEFLGFSIEDNILQQFRARFSRQKEADLMAWHEFEIEHPDTFRAMYVFWVQKKR